MKKCCKKKNKFVNADKLEKIVLVGNPNVGKSVVFHKITGCYVEVSNYPGTTVDVSRTVCRNAEIIDAPGIYGISSFNDEEKVAKNVIFEADYIINVVSAISLDRDLFLTQQLLDLGFKVILIINQFDETFKRGIKIDIEKLSAALGIEVFPTVAIKGTGVENIINCLMDRTLFRSGVKGDYVKNKSSQEILTLEEYEEERNNIYKLRRNRVNSIIKEVLSYDENVFNLSKKIGSLLLNPIIGFFTAVFILLSLYQIVGVWIAGEAVDFIENNILLAYYTPFMSSLIEKFIHIAWLKELLGGEFGLLTMTVQYILGVLLPLVVGFYFFMSMLEDSGYLPRLAALTDRFLSKVGLNGRAVIPLILGFGCVTMAIITTRILGSERERTIANAILGLTIPCSSQLGIIIGLLALIGSLKASLIYLICIFSVLVIVSSVLNKLLPGKSTDLMIDLPPMRLPVFKNILKKTMLKTGHFLAEATPLFFIGSFLITMLNLSGGLLFIQKSLAPLTVKMLNLPSETASIFIMGLIRRDFGAAGLAKMSGIGGEQLLSGAQILVSLVVLTLFVPCIASVVVMYKERGFKEASLIWLGSWVAAFVVGAILAKLLGFISI